MDNSTCEDIITVAQINSRWHFLQKLFFQTYSNKKWPFPPHHAPATAINIIWIWFTAIVTYLGNETITISLSLSQPMAMGIKCQSWHDEEVNIT